MYEVFPWLWRPKSAEEPIGEGSQCMTNSFTRNTKLLLQNGNVSNPEPRRERWTVYGTMKQNWNVVENILVWWTLEYLFITHMWEYCIIKMISESEGRRLHPQSCYSECILAVIFKSIRSKTSVKLLQDQQSKTPGIQITKLTFLN